jgi:hypothetical protein
MTTIKSLKSWTNGAFALSCFTLAVLAMLLSPAVPAQTASTGAIKGTVTDPSGAVVPNVAVNATNTETGAARTAMTGPDGSYVLTLLPLGTYRMKFDVAGFKPEEIPSVTVNVTETAVLNATLEVGTRTQEVTVQAEAEALQTSNATLGTVIASATTTALPLNTRNYTNLLGLASGANASVYNAETLGKGSTDISVNGVMAGQNSVLMDGVSITNHSSNGNLSSNPNDPGMGIVNPDAIQEFKIQTSMFDAGYGRNAGASVNVVTKTGTNDFHGTAFEFFRNSALNANDFFVKESPAVSGIPTDQRPVLNQNQYGGVIGGPIKKDKLFFFASYQETWQKNGAAGQGLSAPYLLPIFPGGDRSNTAALQASLGATFCPTGTDGGMPFYGSGGVQVACNGSNINPVALKLLQAKNPDGTYLIPGSGPITSSGGTTVAQPTHISIPARFTEHQLLTNGDYVINNKNTLSVRYFFAHDPTYVPFNCGNGGGVGDCYPDTSENSLYSNHYGVLKLTTIVTNNLVNEARLSFQRGTLRETPGIPFTNTQFGIASILPSITTLDQINVNGLFEIGSNNAPTNVFFNDYEAAEDVSWTHGKQTIRFGGEYERDQYNWYFGALSIGSMQFQTPQDFLLGLAGCNPALFPTSCNPATPGTSNGSPISNNIFSGGYQAVTPPGGLSHHYRSPFADAYIQDDIKLSRRLTVNLGLRWEYHALVYDTAGLTTNIYTSLINAVPIPTTPTLAGFVVSSNYNLANPAFPAPPVGGVVQSLHKGFQQDNTPLDDFAPRVGLAWSPLANNKLVVRSGGGFFYDREGALNYIGAIEQSEPYSTGLLEAGPANWFSTEAQPYPANASLGWTPRYTNFTTGANSSLSVNFGQSDLKRPLVYEWNMTAQYEFLPQWTIEMGYVGSRGIHQAGINLGAEINGAQLVGNPLGTNTIDAPAIDAGLVTTNTVQNAWERVPYLGFAPGGMLDFSDVTDYKYNSFQATLRKQLSHGFQAQAAYTFSRGYATDNTSNDPNHAQYGENPGYHPQRLAISYLWNVPNLAGDRQSLAAKLATGWSFSGVTTVQDGTPLSVYDNRGGSIFGLVPGLVNSRAEYCTGKGPGNAGTSGSVEQRLGGANGGPGWINQAAFCSVPVVGNGTGYGNSGLGILLGPGQFNWDVSVIKTTKVGGIREDATLQFRTEFFNAFNHAQFNNPSVTDISIPVAGQITSASVNPRLIQFALKYAF